MPSSRSFIQRRKRVFCLSSASAAVSCHHLVHLPPASSCMLRVSLIGGRYISRFSRFVKHQQCSDEFHYLTAKTVVIAFCIFAVYTCQTPERVHCHSVLSSLQTNVHFEKCVCDPADPKSGDCMAVQKSIFLHSCVQHEGRWYFSYVEMIVNRFEKANARGLFVTFKVRNVNSQICLDP